MSAIESTYDDDIERYLRGDEDFPEHAPEDPEAEHEPGRFRITGDRTAEWALKKIAQADAELARVKSRADENIAAIKAWQADASKRPGRDVAYFEGLLREYHEGLLDAELTKLRDEGKSPEEAWKRARTKTYTPGPAGRLEARRGGRGVTIEDEDSFEQWVWENPELGRRFATLSVKKSALAEGDKGAGVRWGSPDNPTSYVDTRIFPFNADGVLEDEPIPGVTWYENPASFSAKPTPIEGA